MDVPFCAKRYLHTLQLSQCAHLQRLRGAPCRPSAYTYSIDFAHDVPVCIQLLCMNHESIQSSAEAQCTKRMCVSAIAAH